MKFYRLLADSSKAKTWHLRAPSDSMGNEIDPRAFTEGCPVAFNAPLTIPLPKVGRLVEFNFADFDMIVTSTELNKELVRIVGAGIQLIPVRIESCDRRFDILNILDLVDCIDEGASEFTRWTQTDGRSDKIGEYRIITRLRIDSSAVKGRHLFRLRKWPVALVASEKIKSLFEERRVTGVKFELVS